MSRPTESGFDAPPFDERPFEQPWHAQLLALTMSLSRAGHFAWPDWAGRFAAALEAAKGTEAPDTADTYYAIWLEALEKLLAERGFADPAVLAGLRQAWHDAYLATPHGRPVTLPELD